MYRSELATPVPDPIPGQDDLERMKPEERIEELRKSFSAIQRRGAALFLDELVRGADAIGPQYDAQIVPTELGAYVHLTATSLEMAIVDAQEGFPSQTDVFEWSADLSRIARVINVIRADSHGKLEIPQDLRRPPLSEAPRG